MSSSEGVESSCKTATYDINLFFDESARIKDGYDKAGIRKSDVVCAETATCGDVFRRELLAVYDDNNDTNPLRCPDCHENDRLAAGMYA